MPGPRNQKKKKQNPHKKDKKPTPSPPSVPISLDDVSDNSGHVFDEHSSSLPETDYSQSLTSEQHVPETLHEPNDNSSLRPAYSPHLPNELQEPAIPPSLLKKPFIHDPGDGPRVKDTREFLSSRLAAPPSLDDPLCAEFAEEAVLQMLCTVLPEETAMILWYNKSRRYSRICPACQRLYRLGDVLPDHLVDQESREEREQPTSPYRAREQELSGLCSPICFILASYNYPGAIRSTWGRMAEELDDATWDLLDGPGQRANDMGLGMLLKMTRCHDLGLGQLFFPDLELDSDGTCNEPESEQEDGTLKGARWKDEVTVKGEAVQSVTEDIVVEMTKLQVDGAV